MATNPWFRVWTDMINDPKWRTISRKSGQKIGDVIAVYMHMLTCASNAADRGHTEGWNDEDVATALDIDTEQVEAIREAMQGRVLDGDYLAGWEKRQPKREREDDNSTDRVRAFREKQRSETPCNATETEETPREEKRREEEKREDKSKAKASAAPKPRKPAKMPLPADFEVSPAVRQWAADKGFDRVDEHFESFIRKAKANGYTYVDWDHALQNAIADDWAKLRGGQARASPSGPNHLGRAGQATAAAAQRFLESGNG